MRVPDPIITDAILPPHTKVKSGTQPDAVLGPGTDDAADTGWELPALPVCYWWIEGTAFNVRTSGFIVKIEQYRSTAITSSRFGDESGNRHYPFFSRHTAAHVELAIGWVDEGVTQAAGGGVTG
jgi:hypothetical protein